MAPNERVSALKLPALSASQVKLADGCLARWGARYLAGLEEPDTPAAALGKAIHAELEAWSKQGVLPSHPVALAGLPHARAPGTALVEREILFSTASSPWRGYIDLQYSIYAPHTKLYGGDIVVQDWKTTSSLRNAKSEEELLDDVQANLYAYEAFVAQRAKSVHGKWVYLPTNGTPKAHPVTFSFERNKVVDFVEGTLDTKASKLQNLYQIRPKWTDLPKSTDYCYAFKRQCPRYAECKPDQRISLGGLTMKNEFRASMMSDFPAAVPSGVPALPPKPPAPPALPPKPPAPPALPPKPLNITQKWEEVHAPALREPGVPDRSFVNPPEAPEVPARSPEEAAEQQGRTLVPPAVPDAASDLAGLTRDQLKAIAVSMGLFPAETKAREASLRKAILDARLQSAVAAEELGAPGAFEARQQLETQMQNGPKVPQQAEVVHCYETEAKSGQLDALRTRLEEIAPDAGSVPQEPDFVLYVNCMPYPNQGVIGFGLSLIVEQANKRLEQTKGVVDYRLIPYTGAAELCLAVRELAADGFFNDIDYVIVDARSVEGSVLLETLSSLASLVVRGF